MSVFDPKTGYRRNLSYDETVNLVENRDADAGAKAGPGIQRAASRFVQSPFFQRLQQSVYEDFKEQQIKTNLIAINAAREQEAAQAAGVPPDMLRHIPPGPPPPPPGGPPGSPGGKGDDRPGDPFQTPDT